MPPLRDRKSDIPALVQFFIARYAKENGKVIDIDLIDAIAPDALQLLYGHAWPGNVRELENAIERAIVLTTTSTIEARHLPPAVRVAHTPSGSPMIPGSSMADLERFAILETMKATGGSTSKAAEILGIATRTIQYRLHEYNAAPKSAVVAVKRKLG